MGPKPQELQGVLVAVVNYMRESVDPEQFVQYVNGLMQSMLSAHDADPQAEFSIGRELIQGVMENAGLRGASLTNSPSARPTAPPTTASTVFPPFPQPTPSPVSQSDSTLSPAQIAMWVGIVVGVCLLCTLSACLQRYCKNKAEGCADWMSGKEANKAATPRVAAEGISTTRNPLIDAQVEKLEAETAVLKEQLRQLQQGQNQAQGGYQPPPLTGNNPNALLPNLSQQNGVGQQHTAGEEKTDGRVLTNPVAALGGNGEEARV